MSSDESDVDFSLSQLMRSKKKKKAPARTKRSNLPPLSADHTNVSERKKRKAPAQLKILETAQVPLEPPILNTVAPPEIRMSSRKKRRSSEASHSDPLVGIEAVPSPPLPSESMQSPPPPASEGPNAAAPLEVEISEFDPSVENHLQSVDNIAKLCRHPEILDSDNEEIQRFSSSITFLREWRDFKYAPRVVRFACQQSLKDSDVIGEITLPQFSSAAFPKRRKQVGSDITGTESNKDFVINVGGAVWALDWCPKDDQISESQIECEFVAVAAHPPESSYHKMGAPLTGRGAIQIWCLLTVREETAMDVVRVRPKGKTLGRPRKYPKKINDEPPKPRGRPRKLGGNPKNKAPPRPKGRPRKPLDVEPIAVDFTYKNMSARLIEDDVRSHEDIFQQHSEDNVRTHEVSVVHQSEVSERTHDDSDGHHAGDNERTHDDSDGNRTEDSERTKDNATASGNLIPRDIALPRMMLCLAHNGKVAWDVKWRPVHASQPGSTGKMGYLAVLLGSGALEVWEVPLPRTVKFIYPAFQARIDPRFIKLQPIFKCSMLKFGGRRSIPLTMEWSLSPPHDMILVGCHDGTVAVWKFSITDPSTETRPLLFFSADTGPIRSLAWTPPQSELGSENIIVTAGFKGFKFWDIRDPFRPMWSHYIKGVSYCVDWLHDPRCVLGCTDDGTVWLISLLKILSNEIPVAGRTPNSKQGILHTFYCSSFSIWSTQASQLTGVVAYCGEDGNTFCFKPTTRLVTDPRRENKVQHHLFGSVLEENSAMVVASPLPNSSFSKTTPGMTRGLKPKDQEKRPEESTVNENDLVGNFGDDLTKQELPNNKSKSSAQQSKGEVEPTFDVFPPQSVAMHRVRWSVNKGSERWFCYGGSAGLVRCQEVDLSSFY